jgi:P27 family predicted phage terminase small subunit
MNKPKATVIPLSDHRGSKVAPAQKSQSSDLFQGIQSEVPSCPAHLCKEAKKHWKYLCKELKRANMIAKIDQGTLANLCIYWARARDAEIQLQKNGEFQQTPNGYVQLSAYSVVFQRYSSDYNKLAMKFGMSPIARKGVKIENPNQAALDLD